jgi:hypothetical protein
LSEDIIKALLLMVVGLIFVAAWFRAEEKQLDGAGWGFLAFCMFIGACNKLN